MKCENCKYCVQVAANDWKVRCANTKIAVSKDWWITEPSYCAYYQKGKHSSLDKYEIYDIMARLEEIEKKFRKIYQEDAN